MHRLALLLLLVASPACKDTADTCLDQVLIDKMYSVCEPGPNCAPCWTCQTFGTDPGWKLLPGMCDAPPSAADAGTSDGP